MEELSERVRAMEAEVAGLKAQLEAIRARLPGEDSARVAGRPGIAVSAGGASVVARAEGGQAALLLLRPPGVPAIALDTAQGGRLLVWKQDGEAVVVLSRDGLENTAGQWASGVGTSAPRARPGRR